MSERVILDPSEVSPSTRTQLDITDWIDFDGVDWGDAVIEATFAQLRSGATPVDFTIPPRQISFPLNLMDRGGTAFATIRSTLQAKMGLWQAQGGWIKRITSSGGTVYADITNATLKLGGGWLAANRSVDTAAALTLTAIPDFYGNEETLSDHTETTLPEITFTETTTNGGDYPLGDRVRAVVDEDQGQSQRGLIWAWRGRNYSSVSTAASAYEAESLQALDTATKVAKSGASGGTVVTHGTLSTNWTPVLGGRGNGTAFPTHTGTYNVWARVFSTAGTTVQARLAWDVGDLVYPATNNAVRLYDGGTFHALNLGEVRLGAASAGAHRWDWQIQAKGDAGAESFSVDRVWFQNTDDSSGVLRAPVTLTEGLITYSARSEFATESGTITGDSLAVGGTWSGGGDADDFTVAAGVATRSAVSDSGGGANNGRLITASATTSMTSSAAKVSAVHSATGLALSGVILRYTNANNFLAAYVVSTTDYSPATVVLFKRVSSSSSTPMARFYCVPNPVGAYVDVGAIVLSDGAYAVYGGPAGAMQRLFSGVDADLATGGGLASGAVGIIDYQTSATANTRTYENFAAWVPPSDAVIYASQSLELGTEGILREDSGGTAYGPVSIVSGDIPRMPNRSAAGTVEFLGKASRGDLESTADTGIDDISVRVYRRASYLTVN